MSRSRCSLVSVCMMTARRLQAQIKGVAEALTVHGSVLAASQQHTRGMAYCICRT